MEKSIPSSGEDVATRIARRTLTARGPDYPAEVRRLLDAGREVMRRNGTRARARVADIVAEAGLSNDAFYRHFASKDVLVAAIIEDGTERLQAYLAHQMAKESSAAAKVRRWVDGVLAQAADEQVAATTLAVMWNAGNVADQPSGPSAGAALAPLLREPFAQLGSANPDLDAAMAAHAVMGRMTDHLWQRTRPSRRETSYIVSFWVAAVTAQITRES